VRHFFRIARLDILFEPGEFPGSCFSISLPLLLDRNLFTCFVPTRLDHLYFFSWVSQTSHAHLSNMHIFFFDRRWSDNLWIVVACRKRILPSNLFEFSLHWSRLYTRCIYCLRELSYVFESWVCPRPKKLLIFVVVCCCALKVGSHSKCFVIRKG